MFNKRLFNTKYHKVDLSGFKFLITGGAGFIGSNIVEYLLRNNAGHVRVLDNLSNGYFDNIKDFTSLSNFEFIEGDIRDLEVCRNSIKGINFISHQAALGSVPRSINDPISTNSVNISGFLNMLLASKESKDCIQFVYAASSSSYGDSEKLPKTEGDEGNPLSPYAVTKLVNELYADVFSRIYGFNTIGLRYFNIFGPKQNPNNPYAAVIPIFCKHFIEGTSVVINGDGNTSRDFTFVENAVQANIRALLHSIEATQIQKHEVFNVACNGQVTLNDLLVFLKKLSGKKIDIIHSEERKGDVRHSRADISKIKHMLSYCPNVNFEEGLEIVFEWYKKHLIIK